MEPDGLGRDIGRDIRVAVAVAANPRTKGEEAGGHLHAGVILSQCLLHGAVNLGHNVPNGRLKMPQTRLHLIFDTRFLGAALVGQPQTHNLGQHLLFQEPLFVGQQLAAIQILQGGGQPGQFGENRPSFGLGGVGGKDGFDVQVGHDLAHFFFVYPRAPQRGNGGADGFAGGVGVFLTGALAQHADAVLVFGDVDELEVVGKGAGDRLEFIEAELADEVGDSGRGLPHHLLVLFGAPYLGQRAEIFLFAEDFHPCLPPDHLAQQIAQQVNVFAQSFGVDDGCTHSLFANG